MEDDTGMGANEGKNAKDLALEERIKEAIKNVQRDEEGNPLENPIVEIAGEKFELDMKIDKETGIQKIHLLGVHILTLDENNELKFAENWKERLSETLDRIDTQAFNKEELINELEEMEKNLNKKKEMEEKSNSENEAEEKEETEKDGEEKPELEENEKEQDGKSEEQIAKQYNVNSSSVIHISQRDRVTATETLPELANIEDDYTDIFIIYGAEKKYGSKIIGVREGKQEEINKIEKNKYGGTNPGITIEKLNGKDSSEIEQVTSVLAFYKISDKEGIAIVRNKQTGKPESLYCRQQGGDSKKFIGAVCAEKDGKNVRPETMETKKVMDSRYYSNRDYIDFADRLSKQRDLEQRGLPSKQKGAQIDEINGTKEQTRENNVEMIVYDLINKSNMIDRTKIKWDEFREKASRILEIMEKDDEITYDQAIEKYEKGKNVYAKKQGDSFDEDDFGPWSGIRQRPY